MDVTLSNLINRLPILRGKPIAVRALAGGITNRNYHLTGGTEQLVLRVAGENSELLGIDRALEHACAHAAFEAGVAPAVIAFSAKHRLLLTRFMPGRVLTARAMRNPATLRELAATLRRVHECPGEGKSFSPFDTVRRYHARALQASVSFPITISSALDALQHIERALGVPDRLGLCHNDLLAGNFIYDGERIWLIDWEYARPGDPFFDLGNLAANNHFTEEQEYELLLRYFGVARNGDLARLRLMRLASDMREAMWGFLQMGISTLAFDYTAYANRHLRRFLRNAKQRKALFGG